jgi:Protein of unknown function (DUF2975)
MKKKNIIFIVLTVLAWIFFVGLCIEAGALVVNFIFSLFNPLVLKNLYQKLDLSEMYKKSKVVFFSMYAFVLMVALLKAILFYEVIKLVSKLDLNRPFSDFVSKQIRKISYITLSIGLFSDVARNITKSITHYGFNTDRINQFWVDGQAYILMAAVLYIIATIFKRGIELQTENDSTI